MESTDNQALDMLSGIMKNPAIGELISTIASSAAVKSEDKAEQKPQSDKGDFSLPPELLERLPDVMGALGGLDLSSLFSKKEEGSSEGGAVKKEDKDKRKALLLALRPYLSPKRCELIDKLLQLEGFTGIMNLFTKLN